MYAVIYTISWRWNGFGSSRNGKSFAEADKKLYMGITDEAGRTETEKGKGNIEMLNCGWKYRRFIIPVCARARYKISTRCSTC